MVADNASSDGTGEMVRREFPAVRLIPQSENKPLVGYNLAFRAVTTPYVLVLDDDSTPQPGTLAKMIACLERNPGIGAAAGNIVGPDGASEWAAKAETDFSADWYNLIGCGFLARRSVLQQAGGYDEHLRLYYNDLELALRIIALGYRIAYAREWLFDHRRVASNRPPHRKQQMMLRNFTLIVRAHFTGFRKWDLIAGQALMALRQAARAGCLIPGLGWFWRGLTEKRKRRRLPMSDGPVVRSFIQEYSLLHHLFHGRKGHREWARMDANKASGLHSGFDSPRAARDLPLPAPPLPAKPVYYPVQANWPAPPCYWGARILTGDITTARDRATAEARRALDASVGCDCAENLKWQISHWDYYQHFLLRYGFITCTRRRHMEIIMREWSYRPVVSFITPVYKIAPAILDECLLSLERQIYPHWELCAVEDGSGLPEIRARLRQFAARHPGRVRLALRDENRGIARTSAEALALATGEFIALLDHDDRLAPDALYEVVRALNANPALDWLYSDHDKISLEGDRWQFYCKPDWSPDLLFCYNYTLHLSVIRRATALAAGGFRDGYDGAQDYDLYLRVAAQNPRVHHIPKILYSFRQSPGSTALDLAAKPYAHENGLKALEDFLQQRRNPETLAEHAAKVLTGNYRVTRQLPPTTLDLAALGPADEAAGAAEIWLRQTGRLDLSRPVMQYAAQSSEPGGATLARALAQTTADRLLVIAAGARPGNDTTLADLATGICTPGVAAIAPKVLDPAGRVDHVGLAWPLGRQLIFPLRGLPGDDPGYGAYGVVGRNVSAVAPIAALFKTADLRAAGGFDPRLDATGAVIAACCALRAVGRRIVADGGIRVVYEKAPFDSGPAMAAPSGRDYAAILEKWPTLIVGGDPYYNRNLHETPPDFGVR